jgi:DnaJ-class molecular chaperone
MRMDTFTDYYALLGVEPDTPVSGIKTAFKKLALQYHPDVYKGEDAEERMRVLLLAYRTLTDSEERKAYDIRHSEHVLGVSSPRGYVAYDASRSKRRGNTTEVSPGARRDRQRHYSFPVLSDELPVRIDLGATTYDLTSGEAQALKVRGMLRGVATEAQGMRDATLAAWNNYPRHCRRCHHQWTVASLRGRGSTDVCPNCHARDWGEYLLLRCAHCHAVFESEQIRNEVGSQDYGDGALCPPYELFPLCPYCGASGWCPAEDARVETLRERAARRAALARIVLFGFAILLVFAAGFLLLTVLR